MSLSQLPSSTIKLITSTQIITSVSSAVKELFENALDAGATSVDVKLLNYGLDRIEVKDNGSGISRENTACMALPHYTSKISQFSDLESLGTYGFRGEALNALCRVGQVSVTTATSSDAMSTIYNLDSSGHVAGTKPAPHIQGTTVVVSNLFKSLPVRRQFMGSSRRSQEELKQVETIVKALAVIKTNIRVTLTHNKCLIWQKNPCSSIQSSFSQVIGYSNGQQMEHMSLSISNQIRVEMLVPKRDCDINIVARSTPSHSLVYVNERPVTYKKIMKILHEQLCVKFGNSFPPRKFSLCLFSISSDPSSIDVNLEPNKTKVLLKDEAEMLEGIKRHLETYYSLPNICHSSNLSKQPQPSEGSEHQIHKVPNDLEENCETPRKKRKFDEDSDYEKDVPENFSNQSNPDFHKFSTNLEQSQVNRDNLYPQIRSEHLHCTKSTSENLLDKKVFREGIEQSKLLQMNGTASTLLNQEDASNTKDLLKDEAELENFFLGTPSNLNGKETESTSAKDLVNSESSSNPPLFNPQKPHVQNKDISITADLDQLWDHISSNVLGELNLDVDIHEERQSTVSETHNSNTREAPKQTSLDSAIIGTELWSMGHVQVPRGELAKGSCVLVGGHQVIQAPALQMQTTSGIESSYDNPAVTTSLQKVSDSVKNHNNAVQIVHTDQSYSLKSPERRPKESPEKASKLLSPQKSPRSPGLESSLQSVSSQMGRRELAAFTKFAREIRPQIILENPGIAFTSVASMLAQKWNGLSEEEKEHYEELARETAKTKKVWQTYDRQKKLEWVKKLPSKDEKKRLHSSSKMNRPTRKLVCINIDLDKIKEKFLNASGSLKGQSSVLTDSRIHLIGQLDPSGTWIGIQEGLFIVINHSRLQEVVVYHRLLSTHTLALKPLMSFLHLDSVTLGEEEWKTIMSFPTSFDSLRQAIIVSAEIIVKNGFKIELGKDGQSALITEVAEALNHYGVKELKEILDLYKNSSSNELCKCRPLRVASYIKGEAMRICRKSPSILEREMVEELMEYWKSVLPPEDVNCLHSKPILTPIYDLTKKSILYR